MVNGNYVLYGDRPSSESEIVDDHVQTRTAERKEKRKSHRTVIDQGSPKVPLDNETDSVKYEKKVKEPRLLRYVPTTEVEENFVTEKFETYDMKPSEERPRRYAFTKKPKNPTDGSVNYAYSRSSSNSPPNLPTISEHCEQYGTYRVRTMPIPKEDDLTLPPYESKLDKYFVKPRELKKFKPKISYNGSHPDSLYRVAHSGDAEGGRIARVARALRWPAALLVVCAALAIFVYFLMPVNMDSGTDTLNSTFWETPGVNQLPQASESTSKSPTRKTAATSSTTNKSGTTKKPLEIDFYDADTEKNFDLISIIDSAAGKKPKIISIPPVFPSHLEPEVQYGNEEADKDKQRSSKTFDKNKLSEDTTLKPHITQKPEKPLAIYFKDAAPINPESINRAETVNDFNRYGKPKTTEQPNRYIDQLKRYSELPRRQPVRNFSPPISERAQAFYPQRPSAEAKFTSGHSKFFGIGIEDIDKMQPTTQSSVYNTRVSPTLPPWRDETTTKNYPVNLNTDVPQCRSPQLALCRGVLPYDLAGPPPSIGGVELASFLTELEYLVSANCSDRARLFVCSLLEPECNPPPFPPKKPCYSLCKAVVDTCDSYIADNIAPAFNCKQYDNSNCMEARTPCFRREMACGDGTCIPRDWVCDGHRDCPGGEDEEKCSQCEKNQYQCPSGGCVQKRWICDGYLDCQEGEDERDETCAQFGVSPVRPTTEGAAGEPGEPGEEGAGSAPAPSVRRPNALPGHESRQRSGSRTAAEDSSKELLMTSDSSNALKRNYSSFLEDRRYMHRAPIPTPMETDTSDETPAKLKAKQDNLSVIPRTIRPFKTPLYKTPTVTQKKESQEGFEPIGLLDDLETETRKESNSKKNVEPSVSDNIQAKKSTMRDFLPENDEKKPTPIRPFNSSNSQYDRIIDGAALLRKAALQEAKEKEMARVKSDEMVDDVQEKGRSSPCPNGELRCVDGLCITLAQLCDGTIDCSDHADEDNCFT